MDVVYVLGRGSCWQDNELRYSLRSLERCSGVSQVFIVGDLPDFVVGVIHIRAEDLYGANKEANICHKVRLACEDERVSERFLFMNDDHFFVSGIKVNDYPYYHQGFLKPSEDDDMAYSMRKEATIQALKSRFLQTKDFDVHTPIIYEKKKFLEMIGNFNWETTSFTKGLLVKSLYCNFFAIDGVFFIDRKLRSPEIEEFSNVFSIGDEAVGVVLQDYMQRVYPVPSKFERTK